VAREVEAERAGWLYWSDGFDLRLICALCAYHQFRSDAPASTDADPDG